jgi:hypothetical protein
LTDKYVRVEVSVRFRVKLIVGKKFSQSRHK